MQKFVQIIFQTPLPLFLPIQGEKILFVMDSGSGLHTGLTHPRYAAVVRFVKPGMTIFFSL